jgi:cytochrome b561
MDADRDRIALRMVRLAQDAGPSSTRFAPLSRRNSTTCQEASSVKSAPDAPLHAESKKHHPMTIAMHWGTVLCIVISVTAVLLCEWIGDKFWRSVLLETHRQLGLLVLFGVAVRIGVRLRVGMADHMAGLPKYIRLAGMGCHWCLYGLLVGLPLLGWAATNAHNLPVRFIGLIPLPALVGEDSELADQLTDNHLLGSWILLALVALHAAAALYHHFIVRDRVLWAMLPGRADAAPDLAGKPARATKPSRGSVELAG